MRTTTYLPCPVNTGPNPPRGFYRSGLARDRNDALCKAIRVDTIASKPAPTKASRWVWASIYGAGKVSGCSHGKFFLKSLKISLTAYPSSLNMRPVHTATRNKQQQHAAVTVWGYSSAGRALAWHARGQRFDPV